MEEGNYKMKVVDINLPKFLGEYLIPIWLEKDTYIKFKTEEKYRINETSQYHNSFAIHYSMKLNQRATIARIGSEELFALLSEKNVYYSKVEGSLYLKINFPKNMKINPEGKLKIIIYDGELMLRKKYIKKQDGKEKVLNMKIQLRQKMI